MNPETKHLIDLIHKSLMEGQIGLIGVRVDNGADYYTCPFCYARNNTMGYASTYEQLDMEGFLHAPNCTGMEIFRLTEQVLQED